MVLTGTQLDVGARRSGIPFDLRDSGSPDDPLFDRPLIRGTITPDGGVIEMRRPGSDEVERVEVRKVARSGKGVSKVVEALAKAFPPAAAAESEDVKVDKPTIGAVDGTVGDNVNQADQTDQTRKVSEITRRVAELYNRGLKTSEIIQDVGKSHAAIQYHIKRARKLGLISEWRKQPTRVNDVVQRLNQMEERIKVLETETKRPDVDARKELDAVVSGLAELTRRIEALEARAAAVTPASRDGETVQRLLRLLELVLDGERRRTA